MKKFLLSLAVLFAASAVAQKQYKTVDMLTEIPGDEAFLLAGDPDGNQFLTTDGEKNLTTAPDDNSLIIFEATGEQTESGFDLYAIKFQATDEYIQDLIITDGFDSSDMLNYKFPYYTTTADLASAAKWTILPAATRYKVTKDDEGWEENWRTYTNQGTGEDTEESTGNKYPYEGAFVIMRDKLTDGEGNDPVYLELQSDYTFLAPWGNNDWYLFTYEEKSADDLLQEFWDTNYPEGPEALESAVGNCVGQYQEEPVAALLAAYEKYNNWLIEGEGDAEEILAESKAAYEALEVNEMADGYYYLVAKRNNSGVMDDNGVMRGDEGFEIPRKEDESIDLTVESSRYLWYFTENPEKGTYTVKNFGTGKYVKTAAYDDNTGIKTGDLADAVDYTVVYSEEFPGTVIFKHFNANGVRDCSWNYYHRSNGKVIGNWYPEDDGNSFFLYNVDESLVDAIAEEVVQSILNNNLQELYDEAVYDYCKGFVYEPEAACTRDDVFSNHGLLTYEKDEAGEPALDEEGNVISNMKIVANDGSNAIHTDDGVGSVVGLLDDKWDTFTHTVWDGSTYPHYFEIDLGEGNELDAIALKMMRRTHSSEYNANFGIGEAIVYARNSEEEDWVRVANLAMTYDINLYARDENGEIAVDEEGNPVLQSWSAVWATDNGENYVGIGTAGLGAKYRYLRLQHYKTLSTTSFDVQQNVYFSASEMALFGATYAPEKSLNSAVPADVLTTFETEMGKAKIQLEAGKATEAQIVALQNAYEAYLENFPQLKLLKDGDVYSSDSDEDVKSVTYTRTLPNLYWNALYLPFEVPYETIADKYNVAYINAIRSYDHDDDGALDELEMEVVKIKAGTLKANYPYLIQAKTEKDRSVVIKVEDATLYAAKENSIDCSTVYQMYEVTGTYNVKTASQLEGKLAISIDGAWQPLATGSQLNPYRLYLSITNRDDSPVKVSNAALSRVRIIEKGQFTGIESVGDTPADNVIYDLSGRRVKYPVKGGVYIQNGKKVVL